MKMVALAYGFIWFAVLFYVSLVGRRLARLQGEVEDLRQRLDRIKH